MGQQIGDAELRVILILAQNDIYIRAVLFYYPAVKGKGNRGPLVFFDAAVLVGLEQSQVVLFIQGIGL